MRLLTSALLLAALPLNPPRLDAAPPSALPSALPLAVPNDNRRAAGRHVGDTLVVELTARTADWRPDGARRPAPLLIAAFAEGDDGAPSVPGPLIRVRAGTHVRVHAALGGRLTGDAIFVHGLHDHP